jgi:polyvinyl alcohol dehydrogenase (cytochrome)
MSAKRKFMVATLLRKRLGLTIGIVGVVAFAAAVNAQNAPAPAARAAAPASAAAPAAHPRAGYQTPPENTAGLYPVNGEPFFRANCGSCHEPAINGAEGRVEMGKYSPEEVYDNLMTGSMWQYATSMNQAQVFGVVRYLTGKSPVPNFKYAADPNMCASDTPLQPNGPMWNGWGVDVTNTRYQANPGFKAADVPKLKLKWAFSIPGTKNPQPLVFGDRVYTGSMNGLIYSLDAKTGCVHWRNFSRSRPIRATMTIGKNASAPSGYALYSGDDRDFLHAYDAQSGKELWTTEVFHHPVGRITGAPALYDGVLYVPISFSEESQRAVEGYPCCTGLGRIVAVNAADGKIVWNQSILNVDPKETVKNKFGVQQYGPAGGSVWDAPTIDAKRGVLYVGTGNSTTTVPNRASDAVVAMDLKTGKVKWINEVYKDDNQFAGPAGDAGPDWDFGASPMLATMKGGKQVIIEGSKSTEIFALDPDHEGKVLWRTPLFGHGGGSGGVHFGTTTDGQTVIAPLNDPGPASQGARPGIIAVDIARGKLLWRDDATREAVCNVASGRCPPGYSAAATTIPGVLFAAATDGHMRAFNLKDGKLLWDYDTATPVDTVNGLKQAWGGGVDTGGPTIAGGMVFVASGYTGSSGENDLIEAFSIDGK